METSEQDYERVLDRMEKARAMLQLGVKLDTLRTELKYDIVKMRAAMGANTEGLAESNPALYSYICKLETLHAFVYTKMGAEEIEELFAQAMGAIN